MKKENDINAYLKDSSGDLAIGFVITFVLSLVGGILAWVSCLGWFTILLLPFFAGYLAGNFVSDIGKSIIVCGVGALAGAIVGGVIAMSFIVSDVVLEEGGSLMGSMIIIGLISLGASAFGGYVRSSAEKPKKQ